MITLPVDARALEGQKSVDAFYLERDGAPLWIRRSSLNRSGKQLLGVLRQSWMNGLNPRSYNVGQIRDIYGNDKFKGRLNEEQVLQIELLLTEGAVRYIRDLSGMRVRPYDIGLRSQDWRQRIGIDEALVLLKENHNDIAEFLLLQEPQGATYQKLKSELRKLIRAQEEEQKYQEPIYFDTLVRPGRGYNNIPKLRARLKSKDVEDHNRYTYDAALVKAVMRFQEENGLKPDGIVGKQTLRTLNQTNVERIKKIIVNMERLRWIPDEKPERFIVVNIPAATLWAVDKGKVRFEMPVVVGRKKRQTNIFVGEVHGVRFNPTWTIPPTIKKEDIVPELVENVNYLADKGIELYDGFGRDAPTLDPTVVDWENVTDEELESLRMVQIAGAHNPLGYIRILMPNQYNIYLHDTNHKELFARVERAQSSGCIRMHHPEKVANFVLENRVDWTPDHLDAYLQEGDMQDVYSDERMPVYLLYYTVWLGDKNNVIYGSDIYKRDENLLKHLEKLDGFRIFGDNGRILVHVVD